MLFLFFLKKQNIINNQTMDRNCVFCGILSKKKQVIWENEQLFAFHSLEKCGSLEHILICPKIHIKDVNSLTLKDVQLLRELKIAGAEVLRALRPTENNFRLIT